MLLFADWIKQGESIIALVTALFGLIGTTVSVYFAVRNFIKSLKGKSTAEVWALIIEIADSAMKEAEASEKAGAEKKELALNIIEASAKAAGIDLAPFLTQLSDYIDQTIKFVNDMTKE